MNLLEYFNRTYNLVCLAKLDFFFFFFFFVVMQNWIVKIGQGVSF